MCHETYSSFVTKLRRHLARSGGRVSEILRVGGWRSATFADYLDRVDLHATVIA